MKENRMIIITEIIIAFILLTGVAGVATADELETIQITNTTFEEQQPSIIFADNHFYNAYNSNEKENNDIFIKKYDLDWNFVEEKQMTTNPADQFSPSIAFENNTKTLYVAYDSVETGNCDIFIEVYDLALNPIGEKRQITKEKTEQGDPSIAFANEYLYIAYNSDEKGNYDIFIEKYDLDWNQIEKEQMTDGGGWNPSITHIDNTLYIAYKNSLETPTDVFVGIYYLDNFTYINRKTLYHKANCTTIDIISKDNNLYAAFDFERERDHGVATTKYDLNLTQIAELTYITDSVYSYYPSLAFVNESLYVAYTSYETGKGDIYAKKSVVKTFVPPNTDIIFVGKDNNFYVVYDSYETGNWDIFFKKYDLNLNSIEKKQLTDELSRQIQPFITFIENNFYVAYASEENGNWDIFIKKYDFDWNEIEKRQETDKPSTQVDPSIVRAGNNFYMAYHSYENHSYETENSHIFINKYDLDWELIEKKQITNSGDSQSNPSVTFAKTNFYVVYESDYYEIVVEKRGLNLNRIKQIEMSSIYDLQQPYITFASGHLFVAYLSNENGNWNIFAREYDLGLNLIGEKKVTDWHYYNCEHPSMAIVDNTLYFAYSLGVSGDYDVDITTITLPLPPPPPKPPIDVTLVLIPLIIACLFVFSGALIYRKRDEFMTSKRYRYFVLVAVSAILVLLAYALTYPEGEEDLAISISVLLFITNPPLVGIISKSARESFTFGSFAFLCLFFGTLLFSWLAYEVSYDILPILVFYPLYIVYSVAFQILWQHFRGWLKEIKQRITKFKPISNPYIAGIPIREKEMFFGRKDIFNFLEQKFITATAKTNILLLGGRRIGKTSALYQIKGGALGDKFIPVFIDLQGIGDMDTYGFFDFVTQEIRKTLEGKGIKMKEYVFDSAKESYTTTFNQVLEDISNLIKDKQTILMFDETEIIEEMIRKGRFDSSIYPYFESIIQHRPKVSCIFTTSPGALSKKKEGKPLFRAADHKIITFLEKEDAIELIKKPVEGFARYTDKVIERILCITGCHPFYIQYICYEIVNILNKEKRNNVKMKNIDSVINKLVKGAPMHLGYVWDTASYDEKIVLSLLSEIIGKEDEFVSASDIEEYKTEKEKKGETTIKLSARIEKTLEVLHSEDILEKDSKNRYRYKVGLIRYWVKGYYSVWRVIGEEEHESVSE